MIATTCKTKASTMETVQEELRTVQSKYAQLRDAMDRLIKFTKPIPETDGVFVPMDAIPDCAIPDGHCSTSDQFTGQHSDQRRLIELAFWPKHMHRLQSRLKKYRQTSEADTRLWSERNSILLHRNFELKKERKDLLHENHRLNKELESMTEREHNKPGISSIIISDQRTDALRVEMTHKNRIIDRLEEALDIKSSMITRLGNKLNQQSVPDTSTLALQKHNSLISRTIVLSPKVIGRFSCISVDCDDACGDMDSEESISRILNEEELDAAHSNDNPVDGAGIEFEDDDEMSSEGIEAVEDRVLDQNAIWILMTAHIKATEKERDHPPKCEESGDHEDIATESVEITQTVFCDGDDEMWDGSEGQKVTASASSICTGQRSESQNGTCIQLSDCVALSEEDAEHMEATVTAFSRFLYGNIPETTDSNRSSDSDACVLSWFSDEDDCAGNRIIFDYGLGQAVLSAIGQ